jgi:peptide/nickel transport system permease protein
LNDAVRYVLRTTAVFLIGFLVILTAEFVILRVLPGDPSLLALPRIPGEQLDEDAMNEIYAIFEKPVFSQYVHFIGDMLSGEFYYSYSFRTDVSDFIYDHMWRTVALFAASLILSIALGALYGYLISRRKSHVVRQLVSLLPLAMMSASVLAVAWINLRLFVAELDWFPVGYPSLGGQDDQLASSILPVLTVSFVSVGAFALIVRDGYLIGRPLNNPSSDRPTYSSDGLFISMPNMQLLVASLMCCIIVVETLMSYRGLGWLLWLSLNRMDYFVVQAAFFLIALLVFLANIATYILVTVLRPNRGFDMFRQGATSPVKPATLSESAPTNGRSTSFLQSVLTAVPAIGKDFLRSPVGMIALMVFVGIIGIAVAGTQQETAFDMLHSPIPYDPTALFLIGAIAPVKLVLLGGLIAAVLGTFVGFVFGLTSRYTLAPMQGLFIGVVSIPLVCLIALYTYGSYSHSDVFSHYGSIVRLACAVSLPIAVLVGHALAVSGQCVSSGRMRLGGPSSFWRTLASVSPWGLFGLKYGLVVALSTMFVCDYMGVTIWESWGRSFELAFMNSLLLTTGGLDYIVPAFIGIALILGSVFLILDTLENVIRRRFCTV